MAPKNSQSVQPKSSQKGTQQTISSFFTKKPSQTPKPSPAPAPAAKAPSPAATTREEEMTTIQNETASLYG
ncbi:hypothetical protein P3342_001928 [Pyrenophora teres f. teres]|nr:hypothetical protein P3342_001928 [Pyrenophora teres f. teres]